MGWLPVDHSTGSRRLANVGFRLMVYRGYTNRWVRTCQEQLFRAIRAYGLDGRIAHAWSNVDYSGQLADQLEQRGEGENSAPANTAFESAARMATSLGPILTVSWHTPRSGWRRFFPNRQAEEGPGGRPLDTRTPRWCNRRGWGPAFHPHSVGFVSQP